MSTALAIVKPQVQSAVERIRALQKEAKALADQHVDEFERAISNVIDMANSISEGGDAYKIGIRTLAEHIAENLEGELLNIRSIKVR